MARRKRIGRRQRQRLCELAAFRLSRAMWELNHTVTRLRDLGDHEAAALVWRSHQRLSDSRAALLARAGRR